MGFGDPMGGVYLMVGFPVLGTSFPVYYHFVTHMLTLSLPPLFSLGINKDIATKKQRQKRKQIKTFYVNVMASTLLILILKTKENSLFSVFPRKRIK